MSPQTIKKKKMPQTIKKKSLFRYDQNKKKNQEAIG